jgi:hypothetical protein
MVFDSRVLRAMSGLLIEDVTVDWIQQHNKGFLAVVIALWKVRWAGHMA